MAIASTTIESMVVAPVVAVATAANTTSSNATMAMPILVAGGSVVKLCMSVPRL